MNCSDYESHQRTGYRDKNLSVAQQTFSLLFTLCGGDLGFSRLNNVVR
jgi:hypothetical protein